MADYEYDEHNLYGSRPLEERWPPLGAAGDNLSETSVDNKHGDDADRLRDLEDEHEQLNDSLLALTTHFAQVQFRLSQIVKAPQKDKESLLKELEEFAFQGIPDVAGPQAKGTNSKEDLGLHDYESRIQHEKKKQERLIGQLKDQLEEMEKCVTEEANKNLEADSTEKLVQKQNTIMEQLRLKMGINMEGIDSLSPSDLHRSLDEALGKIKNPEKAKEQLVSQLTTQIMDLEKFVNFLQGETDLPQLKESKCTCGHTKHKPYCPKATPKSKSHKTDSKNRYVETDDPLKTPKTKSRWKTNRAQTQKTYQQNYHDDLTEDDDNNGCCIMPPQQEALPENASRGQKIRTASLEIIRRALTILQIFSIAQFGCTGQQISEHLARKAGAAPVPGYDLLLVNLQQAVDKVITLVARAKEMEEQTAQPLASPVASPTRQLSRTRSRTSSVSSVSSLSSINDKAYEYTPQEAELIHAVRKDLSVCLKELFQHGLVRALENRLISSKSLVGCIVPTTRTSLPKRMHIWELFDGYFILKHGKEYNLSPARKLSEAFGGDVGGPVPVPVTAKQTLLTALHHVKSTHEPCKRSMDAMFKALVCLGLNQKKLVSWCRLIAKCPTLVDNHYQGWSYMAKTGFEEALSYMERLSALNFDLPDDLAVRHFLKINDAFGDVGPWK